MLAAAALIVAFLIMASTFVPLDSPATAPGGRGPDAHPWPGGSTDPHAGLASLGVLDLAGFTIHIYSTDGGPRYSIYDAASGEELGVLLSAERVAEVFPEIPLPRIDFSAPTQSSRAAPPSEW